MDQMRGGPTGVKLRRPSAAGIGGHTVGRRDRFRTSLVQIPMFAACTKAELGKITRLASPVDVSKGEVLTREGRSGGEFMVIVHGEATVTRRGEVLRRLGPGDWLGEIALLDRGPRTATVVADTPMQIEVIGHRDFMDLLLDVPSVAIKIAVGLARKIREHDDPDPTTDASVGAASD
jgi:CRP/FNR family cyclic AMP-dependent transcriptional regulator